MGNAFKERLAISTDETTQVQPLYRNELFKSVKNSETVEIDGVFASNGKLVQNHILRMAKVFEDGKYREAKLEDVAVGKTDGIFEMEYLKIAPNTANYIGFCTLLECKLDQDFNDKIYRSQVILQVICYLKQLKEQGETVPLVSLVGSKKNCFLLRGKYIDKYIDYAINNYKAASTAYTSNPAIMEELINDTDLHNSCFVYHIDDNFTMSSIVSDIYKYVSGNDNSRKITEQDIARAFDIFSMQILSKPDKVAPRNQAKYFLAIILTPDDCYVNPKKPNKLVIGNETIDIDGEKYLAFKEQFGMEKSYTLEEQRKFTAQADRLIEDADRRRRGDFYTPSVWVDEAHKLISKHLGNNWRNDYIVWDCCWGTGNLTRDYKFKELYASTLIESDLVLGEKYNTNAVKFQYDFLNDDVEAFEELAKVKKDRGYLTVADFIERDVKLYREAPGLVNAVLQGGGSKRLLFLINPPYGTANNMKAKVGGGEVKTAISKTKINTLMLKDNIGAASQQLYAQFAYRIVKLKQLFDIEVELTMFSLLNIVSSTAFKNLREFMYPIIAPYDGFYFCAKEFADCSGSWGVLCSFWKYVDFVDTIPVVVKKWDAHGVANIGQKTVYNLDNKLSLSDWIKDDGKYESIEVIPLTSGLNYKSDRKSQRGTYYKGSLGYLFKVANTVEKNPTEVALFSSVFNSANGVNIFPDTFTRVCVCFTARRLFSGEACTWVNGKDEYMIPDTTHTKWQQFVADSLVYCLFDNASNQSSLRHCLCEGKYFDVKNEFFWLSRAEMRALSQGKYNTEDINNVVEQDLIDNAEDERYMYNQLQNVTLSSDAQAVLDKATELIKKSFKYRKIVSQVHPEYHLNTWDMGYYQLNKLVKEIPELQAEWKEFRQLFKVLGDRMRPLVYELGFLYK